MEIKTLVLLYSIYFQCGKTRVMIALTLSKLNPVALTIFTVLCSHHCPANRFLILHTESKTSDLDLGSLLQNKRRVLRILIRVRKAIKEMGGEFGISGLVLNWLCLCSLLGT